jgi:hypothetical protein
MANYSVSDILTGKQAGKCVDWLRAHGAHLYEDPSGQGRRSDTARAVEFFEKVIRDHPRMHIVTSSGGSDNPLEVTFQLRCSYSPAKWRWEFGDGDDSTLERPVHVYRAPGTYRVAVTTKAPDDSEHRRTVDVTVP